MSLVKCSQSKKECADKGCPHSEEHEKSVEPGKVCFGTRCEVFATHGWETGKDGKPFQVLRGVRNGCACVAAQGIAAQCVALRGGKECV